MKNKKGAETTIGTIVIVILAVLVLIVVVAGFTMGWNNLWAKINIFTPRGESLDAVAVKCDALCLTNQKVSYCCEDQTIKDIGKKKCVDLKEEKPGLIKCETIKKEDCEGIC